MKKSAHGFTLVELLIVIAILAILSVVGFVVFSNVQKGARDARRRADVEAIAKSYENNYSGAYQALATTNFASGSIPEDPNPTKGQYFNWLSSDKSGFKVCAALEANSTSACNATAVNCYCLQSSQGTVNPTSPADPSSTQSSLGFGSSSSAPSCDANGTLLTGLGGYWKMDENTWSGSPGEVTDSSSQGNNGSIINGATTVTDILHSGSFGKVGNFIRSSNQSLSIANSSSLNFGTGPFSISLWYNLATTASGTYAPELVGKSNGGSPISAPGYELRVYYDGRINMTVGDGVNTTLYMYSASAPSPATNSWHHVVAVYNPGGNSVIYVDNVDGPPYTTSMSNTTSTRILTIGSGYNGFRWDGKIDEVRIYNRALSRSEVSSLFSNWNSCIY